MKKQTKNAETVAESTSKKAPKSKTSEAPQPAPIEKDNDLVVFAFRLTPAERELIHRAAGPSKASRFVRALAVAAAGGDEEAVMKLLGGPAPAAS